MNSCLNDKKSDTKTFFIHLPLRGLFLVMGLVSALPILEVSSIELEEVAAGTALLRELNVALKKFAENALVRIIRKLGCLKKEHYVF